MLIGVSAVLVFRLYRKLLQAGEDTSALFSLIMNPAFWTVPRAYLETRSKHGWPSWPAYAAWFCGASGMALLIAGLFRLGD
jgi:hypothetical protein